VTTFNKVHDDADDDGGAAAAVFEWDKRSIGSSLQVAVHERAIRRFSGKSLLRIRCTNTSIKQSDRCAGMYVRLQLLDSNRLPLATSARIYNRTAAAHCTWQAKTVVF